MERRWRRAREEMGRGGEEEGRRRQRIGWRWRGGSREEVEGGSGEEVGGGRREVGGDGEEVGGGGGVDVGGCRGEVGGEGEEVGGGGEEVERRWGSRSFIRIDNHAPARDRYWSTVDD